MLGERYKVRERVQKVLVYSALCFTGIIIFLPVYWVFIGSVRPLAELMTPKVSFFPQQLTLENYVQVFERMTVGRYFLNSVIVTLIPLASVLLTSSFAGYVFAKYKFRGKEIIFLMFLSTIMIPFYAYVVSLYRMISKIGWIDTYHGIFVPWMVSSFGIFLMRQFMEGIPDELIDAAKMDGASDAWIYFRIMLPLSKPALGVLGIFVFMWEWNSFFWPLIIINSNARRPLPVGIATLVSNVTNYPEPTLYFALSMILIFPVTVVFLLLQKTFTRSVALSGLKM